ncbi:Na(+)-translocating NADH-quinone reductase subunit C [Mangrovimonas sp. CR14]|uniref:Na(+)-translocating NADH-quinone reductase subunit C n=1 Tax=Mangrovimonas sp. CR14 TaxID=2706120 RepID=UPI00141DB5A2|nr:Na(+)-translocating NADH-quinone reductase subunit C [Mangrovimonas sp. CR14]NIK91310.1 Na(+)-translocating NADH-quinone reductase subunit C [Mangrovimonas sp. CR14]
MSNKTDSNVYTVLFAVAMVIIVGALLAFTASSLRPRIDKNKQIEKQQNILYAMGVNNNDESSAVFVDANQAPELFNEYIKKQLVLDLNGSVIKEVEGREIVKDYETQPKDDYGTDVYLMDIKKEKANKEQRRLPLFIGEKDGKTFYIAPVYGKGLWDAIWGFVSLDENMVVQGVFFDHAGETPGLGANIKERFFMDDFTGEYLLSQGSFKGIDVAKGNADPKNEDKEDNAVDAIAGATITGNGVAAMLKSDLKLYKPYFDNLKNN